MEYSNAESDLAVLSDSSSACRPARRATGASRRSTRAANKATIPRRTPAGIRSRQARSRHGQRHVPDLPHHPGAGVVGVVHGNLATAENTAVALGAKVVSNSYGRRRGRGLSPTRRLRSCRCRDHCQLGRQWLWRSVPSQVALHVTAAGGHQPDARQQLPRSWSETVWSGRRQLQQRLREAELAA